MNKARRAELEKIVERIADLRVMADEIKTDLEAIRDEEQDYFDNMPESLQGGEKGENAQTEIDAMEEAINALEEIDSVEYTGAQT